MSYVDTSMLYQIIKSQSVIKLYLMNKSINPDKAATYGATVQAAILSGTTSKVASLVVVLGHGKPPLVHLEQEKFGDSLGCVTGRDSGLGDGRGAAG